MPQPHLHYIITEIAMSEVVPHLWQAYSNFSGSDPFWNDVFYMLDLQARIASKSGLPSGLLKRLPLVAPRYPEHDYSFVSDIMHWESSLEAVCNDMDYIKEKTLPDSKERDKLKAALYRALGHAIPDARLHPEIYRRTGDHWKIHTKEAYDRHKKRETDGDAFGLGMAGHDPYSFNYAKRVSSGKRIDEDVLRFLKNRLRTYAGMFDRYGLDYKKMLGRFEQTDNHPLQDAYRHYINAVSWLWEGMQFARFLPQRVNVLVPTTRFKVKELKNFTPLKREPWVKNGHADMPDYSFRDLIDLSIRELKATIVVIEQFFGSEGMTAREFISKYNSSKDNPPIPFLQENTNLDTGLPASMNDELLEIDKKHRVKSGLIAQIDTPPIDIPSLEDITNFGVGYLGKTYRALEKLPGGNSYHKL